MAKTIQKGNRKAILIRDDYFNTIWDALKHFNIQQSQYYQTKSAFKCEPHEAIMICLNHDINGKILHSLNLAKYLRYLKDRYHPTRLITRSHTYAIADFLEYQRTGRQKPLEQYEENFIKSGQNPEELEPIKKELLPDSDTLITEEETMPMDEVKQTDEKETVAPSLDKNELLKQMLEMHDFSSFSSDQDFSKIGRQFVLASNIKTLKEIISIVTEVGFPITDDEAYQLQSDLEPIKKMIDDSMQIVKDILFKEEKK